jgi:seryl-tRNA synthetase
LIDLARIRQETDEVRRGLLRKGADPAALEEVLADDGLRREMLTRVEVLKAERNSRSKEIGQAKKRGENTEAIQAQVRTLGEEISRLDGEVQAVETRQADRLLRIPNLPHASVPDGKDASQNREESVWGEPPAFDFAPRAHDDLGTALGLVDFERAAKVSGARFVFYRGLGAAMERALISYMLDTQTSRGYTELLTPYLVRPEALVGTGNLPKFEADLFKVDDGAFYLIPTAEVPVTNFHRDEILEEKDLPLSYCAFTPCFRSEAGSHGQDTKGMIRQHQFHKVELVKFSHPDHSYDDLDRLTSDAEAILQGLGLHYRKVTLCAGDMSFSSAKTFDLEVWLPSQGRFREISSCSNFEDFQARRANIRFRPADGGKPRFAHTLNGSGLAVGRTLVAVLEQYQRADGAMTIPPALRPYLGGRERIDEPPDGS